MALDTELNRRSAYGFLLPFRMGMTPDTAGIVREERQAIAFSYSGLDLTSLFVEAGRLFEVAAENRFPIVSEENRFPIVDAESRFYTVRSVT
jgi:hypothetical protein